MAARVPPSSPMSAKPVTQDPLHSMETYNSQDFVELVTNEFRMARRDSDDVVDEENPPEEGEEEYEWLKQTGFDSLVSLPETASEEMTEDFSMLNSLSIQQADVVKRRVATLRNTLRRRSKDKGGRHTDVRSLFPSEGGSRSRSATPDSLDSLSPPRTPPGARSRLEAGSPHSQGYHSSSRGSLDHLEKTEDEERERTPEYRHVLRIPLDKTPPGSSPPKSDLSALQQRHGSHDALDKVGSKTRGLFETSGHYKPSRKSAPPESNGIEVVSYQPLDSQRRRSERSGLGEVGKLHIPRPRTGSKTDPARPRGSDDQSRLGRTFLDYLSEGDVRRVQKLALIQFTVVIDEHKLSYSRRKARKRRLRARSSVAEGAVFGCSLTALLERDRQRQSDVAVPLLLERVLTHLEQRGLHEEGLLRVPGHQQKVDQLRRTVDEKFYTRPGDVDEALRSSSANDVAALVKLFLRELPAPLLTRELMDAFHRTDALPGERQVEALALLCLQLPADSRAVLRRLLAFLAAVAAQEAANKMSLENVAMIMAPNLMWPAQRRQKDISIELEYAAVTSRVVRNMIRHRESLWEVPPSFVSQVRRQHETEQHVKLKKEPSRQVKKFLRRKESSTASKVENNKDLQEIKIKVTAPQFNKTWNDVRLKDSTTAGDVVTMCLSPLAFSSELTERIQGRRGSYRQGEDKATSPGCTACLKPDAGGSSVLTAHFLYEHDGNIGYRRLEHSASVLACHRVNPGARWEIHCCHGSDLSSTVEIVAD